MRYVLTVVLAGLATAALGNDSTAELSAGGLVYVRSDVVSMESEDLYISQDEVRVDYVFRNNSDADVETVVAFPMPDITGNPYEMVSIPNPEIDNFLNFSVRVSGAPVDATLDQRAIAFGVDVTDDLRAQGVPLVPFGDAAFAALANLPEDVLEDFEARGMIFNDVFDVGEGMEAHPTPTWTLQSAYWWRMIFPAGAEVPVSHRYTPGIGGTAGLSFISYDGGPNPVRDEYVRKYCMDEPFERAVQRRLEAAGPDGYPLYETRISYILTTGQNWYGPIGRFHLTVDKGSTRNLVSFCGDGIEKTGPTTFELTYTDYYPERDLDVLLLQEIK